jgi:trk system potassium uptake protein TrkA
MRVVIVGGGKIGSYLARELASDGHVVAVIESDPSHARKVVSAAKVLVFEGDGTAPDVLRAADIERADWALALTGRDEDNLVASQLALTLGAKRVMARLNDPSNRPTFEALEIPVVSVTDLIGQVITKEVEVPDLADSDLFAAGKVAVQELEVPESFESRPVLELDLPEDALIVTRVRGDDVTVVHGSSTIKPGDRVLVASSTEAMSDVAKVFDGSEKAE